MTDRDDLTLGRDAAPERESQRHRVDDARVSAFAVEAAQLLHDSHGEDILLFDVRELSDVSDYILIATGTSDRQMRSVADDIEKLGKRHDLVRLGRELDEATTWIVLDFVDVIVHLFDGPTRAHYDLEMLWGDAKRVDWRRKQA